MALAGTYVAHVFQPAPSGRAKCRGCGEPIPAGEIRFGESLPNPYAEGETLHWFHVACAAYKRPEPFLESLESAPHAIADLATLADEARLGAVHRRVSRINGAERSPSGRATCRACRTAIAKGAWRISLVFYESGRFEPSGFIHARCAAAYFETTEVLARIAHFSPGLSDEDAKELRAELDSPVC